MGLPEVDLIVSLNLYYLKINISTLRYKKLKLYVAYE